METPEQIEVRRSKNYHTLSELEQAGNMIVFISELKGQLIMRRGKTITHYQIAEYGNGTMCWYPIAANTTQK
jgi:hypothetical protein